MKIDFSYIPQAFYSIKEKAYDSLTSKQKLISIVAFAAITGLALYIKVLYSRHKENQSRLRLQTEERERAQEQLRAEELRIARNLALEQERQIQQKLQNDNKRELLRIIASETLDPLLAETKFQEAFSYGKDIPLLSSYASFLMKQKKWEELELQLVELMQLGDNSFKTKEKYARALLKQNKPQKALNFLEKELLFQTKFFYSNSVLSRFYINILSEQGEDREVELFMENGFKNNTEAFLKNNFLIDRYTDFLLFEQDNEADALLVLNNVLQANPEVFYSVPDLSEKYAILLLYYQTDPAKANEFLSKAINKNPYNLSLIMAHTEALIQLNKPYEEIIVGLESVMPKLMDGTLECCDFENIALLAKYIEVQRQFGLPQNGQYALLNQIISEKSNSPELTEEKTWLGIGLRVLGHTRDSLQFLKDAANAVPANRIAQTELKTTLKEAEAEHKAAFQKDKNNAGSYFSFLLNYKEEKEAIDFFQEFGEADGQITQQCLGALFQLEKFELIFSLLENRLNTNQVEFIKANLYGPFAIVSIYECKKNQEKILELLLNPKCDGWHGMDKYKFIIEASLQINRPHEEIIKNLGIEMVDWANSVECKDDVDLLAKYIDLHSKCRKSIDAPLNALKELLKEIPISSYEKYAHSCGHRVIGDLGRAQALLQEAYAGNPKDYLIKYEYLEYFK
ncbi:MAG: hypothetical protein H0V82_01975 [Candidatus Protochlamydia sp.]|nr:hypothetical protein [Candidatus Protochlamydia sp.]